MNSPAKIKSISVALFSEPKYSNHILGVLNNGDEVRIEKTEREWAYLSEQNGWVPLACVNYKEEV